MARRRPAVLPGPFDGAGAAVASVVEDTRHVAAAEGNRWRRLAMVFGRLVAQGALDMDGCLASMTAEAARRWPERAAGAMDTKLAWALRDAVQEWDMARGRTRFAVRRAVGPLLAERAKSAALLAAARAVNAEAGGPLRDDEVLGLVRNEIYWASRRLARVRA